MCRVFSPSTMLQSSFSVPWAANCRRTQDWGLWAIINAGVPEKRGGSWRIRSCAGAHGVLRHLNAWIVGFVHDEILLEVPLEQADRMAAVLKETMEAAAQTILKAVPAKVDAKVSMS